MKGIIWQDAKTLVVSLIFTLVTAGCGTGDPSGSSEQGTNIAVLTVSDGPMYNFGIQLVNSSTDHEFTVSNLGAKDATDITGSFFLSLSYSYKDGSFPGTGGTCGTTLVRQSMCTIVVTFTPKFVGVTETSITINYYNGSSTVTTSSPILHGQGS